MAKSTGDRRADLSPQPPLPGGEGETTRTQGEDYSSPFPPGRGIGSRSRKGGERGDGRDCLPRPVSICAGGIRVEPIGQGFPLPSTVSRLSGFHSTDSRLPAFFYGSIVQLNVPEGRNRRLICPRQFNILEARTRTQPGSVLSVDWKGL